MPPLLARPLRTVLVVLGLFVLARLALPTTVFDALGLTAMEAAVWSWVAPIVIPIGIYEVFVIGSAVCDHRDATLVVVGWRQAWAVAHITCLVRGWRRGKWIATGLNITRKRLAAAHRARKAAREIEQEYVVLDPGAPFDGMVVEPVVEPDDEEKSA